MVDRGIVERDTIQEQVRFFMVQVSNTTALKQTVSEQNIVFMLLSDMGCNVCLAIYPEIEALEKKHPKIHFISASPSEDKHIVGDFLVFVYPTILIYADGKEMYRFERLISMDDIENKLLRLESLYYD